jgi:hypothetical protein
MRSKADIGENSKVEPRRRPPVGDGLPACQMIVDVTGDVITHGRQLKQFVLDDRIIGLFGKLPILGRFVP